MIVEEHVLSRIWWRGCVY